MKMNGQVHLPANRETIWSKLNDPKVLKECIPGCQSLDRKDDGGFSATIKVKVGPVSATFNGTVTLTDLDRPNSYKISGQGQGGLAGFASGGAAVFLAEATEGGTFLSYTVEANVGGKLAQLGVRLISSTAMRLADQFFDNFTKTVCGELIVQGEAP